MKISNVDQTSKLAKDLARKIRKPTVIALKGDLGAGKTTFTQSFAKTLGVKRRILSPTFVFVRSYPLAKEGLEKLHHVDLYRCRNLADAKSIGIEEILNEPKALVVIEWPEIIAELLPKDTVKIEFVKLGENEREIKVS